MSSLVIFSQDVSKEQAIRKASKIGNSALINRTYLAQLPFPLYGDSIGRSAF
jgi:hypothetical protein